MIRSLDEVARRSQEHGTRRRGTSLNHLIKHGDDKDRYTHSQDAETLTLTYNNPRQTWGRTDYLKGNMTGNTWDEIKTQMGTN